MKTVWKYQLKPLRRQQVDMPEGAIILSAHSQRDQICLWAEVDPQKPPQSREIYIVGTGHEVEIPDDRLWFVGTVPVQDETFIFHVYEIRGEAKPS